MKAKETEHAESSDGVACGRRMLFPSLAVPQSGVTRYGIVDVNIDRYAVQIDSFSPTNARTNHQNVLAVGIQHFF